MNTLISQYGLAGIFIGLSVIIGIANNVRMQKITEQIENIALDQLQLAIWLVETGGITQAQLCTLLSSFRGRGFHDSGAVSKLLEAIV